MAIKRTRRKTGSNNYETITHNNRTGRTTRTKTVKLGGGVTQSTSTNSRKSGSRRTYTFNNNGWITKRTYSSPKTVKTAKSVTRKTRSSNGSSTKQSRSSNGSSIGQFIFWCIVFVVAYYSF